MINYSELGVKPLQGLNTKGILYSHEVKLVEYDEGLWVLKKINQSMTNSDKSPKDALVVELFSQNFYRLLLANQPEYRYMLHVDGITKTYYVLSEYQQFFSTIPEDMGHNFENGLFKGLGHIVLIAMFLEETDLKNGNIGLVTQPDGSSLVIKLDGDYSLASFRPYQQIQEEMITSEKIDILPFSHKCKSYNWLDLINQYSSRIESKIINPGLNNNILIRNEINGSILKILMLNRQILECFVNATIPITLSFNNENLISYICNRQRLLLEAAFKNTSFLSYLDSEHAIELITEFNSYLHAFRQEKVEVFKFEIDLMLRFNNLRAFGKIYSQCAQNDSLQNRQFEAYLKKQVDRGLEQNFEPSFLSEAIEHYATWHDEFKEYVNVHAAKFTLELMQVLYDKSSKECLLHVPAHYFEKILKSQCERYIEILSYQRDSIANDFKICFDNIDSLTKLIHLYSDILYVIKQSSNLYCLMEKKLKLFDFGIEEAKHSREFLIKVYSQSTLEFRKQLSDEEILTHYVRELLIHVITELKESEGEELYQEIISHIDHHAEDSLDKDLGILNDLLDYKSEISSPEIKRLKRHLSSPSNSYLQIDYNRLSFSERIGLFNQVREYGLDEFISRHTKLPRGIFG